MADYILNMGGYTGSASVDAVNVFKTTANGLKAVTGHGLTLSQARDRLGAAACGNYILAMGGVSGSTYYNTVDVFKVTANGVEAVPDHGLSLSVGRDNLGAASCGDYIIAMGGSVSGSSYSDAIDIFQVTANGVEAVADHGLSLSQARDNLGAASCGDYIIAMGGFGSGASSTVDVFKVTANGVEAITGHGLSLSAGRSRLAAASCGNYILAMGGYNINTTTNFNTVDVFHVTENGVEAVTDHGLSLSVARHDLAAASCGNYILAMGGVSGSTRYNTVDVFHVTENGVEAVANHGLSLSEARSLLSAVSCGNYILAMGGSAGSTYFDTVDIFEVN